MHIKGTPASVGKAGTEVAGIPLEINFLLLPLA